jgi:membrane protease YdiL (CAAX protease family)
VIFGLGHSLQGPLTMGLTAVLGFFLGLVIVFHRSIWPAVLAHGMFDATTLALLPLLARLLKEQT